MIERFPGAEAWREPVPGADRVRAQFQFLRLESLMVANRSRSRIAVLLGLIAGLGGTSVGCGGSGSEGGNAAAISPLMKKKADENLKGYAARAAARALERRSKVP